MDNQQTGNQRPRPVSRSWAGAILFIVLGAALAAGIMLLTEKFAGASYLRYHNAHHSVPMVGDERLLGELVLAPVLMLAAVVVLVIWRRKTKVKFSAIGFIVGNALFLIRLAGMVASSLSFNW